MATRSEIEHAANVLLSQARRDDLFYEYTVLCTRVALEAATARAKALACSGCDLSIIDHRHTPVDLIRRPTGEESADAPR